MAGQIYWDDVSEGMQIPPFKRGPLEMPQIIKFSSAVENYEKLHQDYKWCIEQGYADVVMNGPIKNALLAVMLTNWMGEEGFLKRLGCQHRAMDFPGHTLVASGKVAKKYINDGLGYVDLDVKVENQKGEISCPGTATVILPIRGGKPVPIVFPGPR